MAAPGVSAPDLDVQQKYIEERNKRLRDDGLDQFVRLSNSQQYKRLQDDPWADHVALNAAVSPLTDNAHTKFLILGAGYGGLLFAVRLIQAGFTAADIRLVDDAGGFGGTWYWNRYPGLMCDVESYIYMPLLEETGYMPKHRYAYGEELRLHAERIAEKWELQGKALFRTRYTKAEWDEGGKRWRVDLKENRGPEEPSRTLQVHAQFVFAVSGALNSPQIPRLAGLENYNGAYFHSSRWDYNITGGTCAPPTDGLWDLPFLSDKRVGIIGTGATALQIVPQLARNAKHLYVFQRTPSSVAERGQRATDPETWQTLIAAKPGWQQERTNNFHLYLTNCPERTAATNKVDDGWTHMPSYVAILGGESTSAGVGLVDATPDGIGAHLGALQADDFTRSERIRGRVDVTIDCPETAQALKAWYPAWCKRPGFHDEYLPSFNRDNVTLVDTNGRGVDGASASGLVVGGVEYPVDVLVLATGYVSPSGGTGSPGAYACLEVRGREGRSIDDKWIEDGAATLHGVSTNGYPNFFFPGPSQAGMSVNFTSVLELSASHVAYILKTAHARAVSQNPDLDAEKLVVEVSKDTEEAWTMEVLKRVVWFAAMSGCTPGFLTSEGESDKMTPEQQMKRARGAPWGEGILSFAKVLDKWREEGKLDGYVVGS
ncbi:hypothetical protein C8F01DRAFT_1209399 [Mycena amicta]|nr:hypothetical protein C8F01DRAFT_1209399 [Mycena amicta]